MKQLQRKLHSQSGASILLALLFLLACMMVAASILMAAVSNAGKIRSNYDEQQKYLALSSALRLVSGQLEQATYTGKYTVTTWTEKLPDEDDPDIMHEIDYYHVEQNEGTYTCGELDGVNLSFLKELDGVFANQFQGKAGYETTLGGAPLPSEKTLTVTVSEGAAVLSDQFPEVTVNITMNANRSIHLKATLTDPSPSGGTEDASYVMEAELTVEGAPALDFSPGGALPSETAAEGTAATAELKTTPAPPVKWKLAWVSKEVEDG